MATEVSLDWAMATEVSVATATTTEASVALAMALEVAASIDWATTMALEAMDMVLAMEIKNMVTPILPLLGDTASPASTEE